MSDTLFKLEDVNVAFDGHSLYQPSVNLEVVSKEKVLLFGASASGKTVLFKVIAGLHEHSAGQITWQGKAIPGGQSRLTARNQLMSIVPSTFSFIEGLSVKENILLPGHFSSVSKDQIEQRFEALLELFDFSDFDPALQKLSLSNILAMKSIAGLSNGQKEIVALARGLLTPARILMADELLRSFNSAAEQQVWNKLIAWLNRHEQALFMITHKEHLKKSLAEGSIDRILSINSGTLEAVVASHD
ncbi:ATP-binding cassette domain-containing protein [Marinospirillum perlucidum]|uniref:ATP-binding cassette domain-containing protein n=1 Tax=Marinospirillum perlucidum TaxID=1982602 RepID=UPI000DF3E783|nr:ATP-binding cassette domain-containing protein [Marinospirillum perlucidum]